MRLESHVKRHGNDFPNIVVMWRANADVQLHTGKGSWTARLPAIAAAAEIAEALGIVRVSASMSVASGDGDPDGS